MNIFLKAAAGILTALVLWICLSKYSKDYSTLLTMAVCAIILTSAIGLLQPVINFIGRLQTVGTLDKSLLNVIFKAVGIGIVAEIAIMICKDAGNESMGKSLQIITSVVVLWLSIPVFEELISLLDKILGTV